MATAPKIKRVMDEWKAGTLHSGSAKGPVVTNQKQAVAIALSEAQKAGQKVAPRKKKVGYGQDTEDKTESKKHERGESKKVETKERVGAGQAKKKVGVGGFIGNIPPQSQVPLSLQGALAGGGANPPMAAPPVMQQPGAGPMPPDMGGMPPGPPAGPPMLPAPPKKSAPKKRGKPKAKAKAKAKPASKKPAPKKKAAGKKLPPWLAGTA